MSSDSIALLAQRLQALQEEGIKVNPATANPGEHRQRVAGRCKCLTQPDGVTHVPTTVGHCPACTAEGRTPCKCFLAAVQRRCEAAPPCAAAPPPAAY